MAIYIVMMTRMSSKRAPNKTSSSLAGEACFHRVIERVAASLPDAIPIVCTTTSMEDDAVEILSTEYGYEVHRTPETDAQQGLPRLMDLVQHREMADEDVIVWASHDTPFCYCKALPQAISLLEAHGCGRYTWAENLAGTLLWGVTMPFAFKVWSFKLAYRDYASMEFHSWWTPWCHEGTRLLLHIPDRLKVPWLWKQLVLDYPSQVSQAKIIYRKLWNGKPLNIFDVYKYLGSYPDVANMTADAAGPTKYGQHLDTFWEAYRRYPHVLAALD